MKTKKIKKTLKKLIRLVEEENQFTDPFDEFFDELFEEEEKELPLTDANGEELIVGRLYKHTSGTLVYYSGIRESDNTPIFELVDHVGVHSMSEIEGFKSIASNTYWGYNNINKEVEIAELEKDEYYYVEDTNDDFWMIGKVEVGNNSDNGDTSLRGDYYYMISADKVLQTDDSWCYSDTNRTFRKATEEEIKWLEKCNKERKYIPKEETLQEYKVGDWVITRGYCDLDGEPLRINEAYFSKFTEFMHYRFDQADSITDNFSINHIVRLATPKEIEQHLVIEASKRGFTEGFQLKRIKGHNYEGEISNIDWYYNHTKDELTNLSADIYKNGKWSEIKEPYEFKIGDFVYSDKHNLIRPKVTVIIAITKNEIWCRDYVSSSWTSPEKFNKKYRLASEAEIRKYCDFTRS